MKALSLFCVLVAAVSPSLVSARLGTVDTASEAAPWRIFGEAAAPPVNAEKAQPAQPRSSILLTEASLQTLGAPLKEATDPVVTQSSVDGSLEKVCERTRLALSAQAAAGASGAMPGGPVYKECMAALAPFRNAAQDSDAVDTLSDCMALVNALVSTGPKGGDCHNAVGVLEASKRPPAAHAAEQPQAQPQAQAQAPAQPPAQAQAQAPPPPAAARKAAAKRQEDDAMELVAEAMTAVCTETVRDSEVGIKSEADAVKLANSVAPICQDRAKKHLGDAAAAQSLTHEWCRQLDGRLTIALETGFFFALSPEEAERQAGETNPYASTTRRKFCGRFVESLRKQAQTSGLYLGGPSPPAAAKPPPPAATPPPAAPVAAAPLAALPPAPPAPRAAAVEAPPAPTSPPQAAPPNPPAVPASAAVAKAQDVPVAVLAHGSEQRAAQPTAAPAAPGVDMLRLVQALSAQNAWGQACEGLLSRLTSEEGSVTEEYALGDGETPEGTKVLTFNAEDQGQIRKCAAQLKVLAIRAGVLTGPPPSGAAKETSALISTGATVETSLGSFEDAEALMDSPWAADACGDIAHGFLTARLAHPGLEVPEFCPLYARDLQAMRGPRPRGQEAAARAAQDIQQLRRRSASGSLKRHMAKAQAAVAPKPAADTKALRAPAAQVKRSPPAALISGVPEATGQTEADDDKEGMDFWRGLLQG